MPCQSECRHQAPTAADTGAAMHLEYLIYDILAVLSLLAYAAAGNYQDEYDAKQQSTDRLVFAHFMVSILLYASSSC